ncbi:MAG TPA: GNAT family N-acetyltransferase [Blastocatellia bacterium]|nr:GNAT family N-acetyltransferase [Blastocatellia bacterium]
MTPTTYRLATIDDAAAIVEFQIAMARETEDVELDLETCRKGVQAIFESSGLGQYYVAERNEKVIGSLLITYEWSDWRNGMIWWVQSVYVIPEARGQRVYAGLYEHVKAIVEANENLRGIRLYVDERNKVAQQVYAKLGMNGEHYRVFEWMKS